MGDRPRTKMTDKLAIIIEMVANALPKGLSLSCYDLDRLYAGEVADAEVRVYSGDEALVFSCSAGDRMFFEIGEERVVFRSTYPENEFDTLMKIIKKWKRGLAK